MYLLVPKLAAKQICLIESDLFRKITAMDLLQYAPHEQASRRTSEGQNRVGKWSERFNLLSRWVSTCIVTQREVSSRATLLKQFIRLGNQCVALNNFNASYAIFAALFSNPISRLIDTWSEVSSVTRAEFEELKTLFDVRGGHRNYTEALEAAQAPIIPWLGIFTKHIFFIKEHNDDHVDGNLVNFYKFSSLVKVIRKVFSLQKVEYDFLPDPAADRKSVV